ncbi:MAG: class I SAM-dependent methyltransferase [Pedobacter sp.]|nr:MAG: class I SAM-dependent methyltransferase [Pedobacter sp.]
MRETKYYDDSFYAELDKGSYVSAQKILPVIKELFNPACVIDIGCGVGYWLKVWKEELMVDDILGVEGTYVTDKLFKLESKHLLNADLKLPLDLGRRFDLVMSMEVAEHIPEENSDIFIENLIRAGDIIMFSAAIKGQLGTYHINEQMPEYWAKKFKKHNYIAIDYLRPKIWNDSSIAYWYRQNTLLFIREERLVDFPYLRDAALQTNPNYLTRIHPEKYFAYVEENKQLKDVLGFIRYKLYRMKKRWKGDKTP